MALVERYHSQEPGPAIKSTPLREAAVDSSGCTAGPTPRQAVSLVQSAERAEHVGILAMEVYFSNVYVSDLFQAFHTALALHPLRIAVI